MERDYSNDYDAWLAETGGDTAYGGGGTIPTDQWLPANPIVPQPGSTPTPTPPPTTGGGKTPQQIEAEGRAYDAAQNPPLIGGYMNGNVWVNGSPSSTGGGGGGGGGGAYGNIGDIYGAYANPYGGYGGSQFNFQLPGAPMFDAPDFNAPTGESILNEPGYNFRLSEGAKALERSAASKGIARTGGTMKGLVDYNQNFASHEYNNVFNRALQTFDNDYRGKLAEFQPRFDEWQTRGQVDQRTAENSWNREWDAYKFAVDDQFKRTDAFQKFLQWQSDGGDD